MIRVALAVLLNAAAVLLLIGAVQGGAGLDALFALVVGVGLAWVVVRPTRSRA